MEPLTPLQRALLSLNAGLGAYDWNETRRNVVQKGGKEFNPALPERPSPEEVNRYFAGLAGAGAGAVAVMPEKLRTPVLAASAALQHANLKGTLFGNPDMTKPGDKNSIPIALATAAATYGLSGLLGKSDGSRTVSILPQDKDGVKVGFTQRFADGGIIEEWKREHGEPPPSPDWESGEQPEDNLEKAERQRRREGSPFSRKFRLLRPGDRKPDTIPDETEDEDEGFRRIRIVKADQGHKFYRGGPVRGVRKLQDADYAHYRGQFTPPARGLRRLFQGGRV